MSDTPSSDQPSGQPGTPGGSRQQRWPGWPSRSAGRPAPRRTGLRRLLPTWRMVLAAVLVGLTGTLVAVVAGYLLVDIPEPKSAAAAQSNVYLYADGSPLATDGEVNRVNVPLDQVPSGVRHAVLAAEDRDFYHDPAVDLLAMGRAAWNMLRGEGTQSGSTITQQYVKNYYLDQEQTVTRKIKELFISVKLDREISKDEILEGYLNTSYFGRGAYGVQAAAQAYYGKDASQLTTAEGAYLAALLNAPSAYDVRANPDNAGAARARWEYVLDGMVSEGWLSEQQRAQMSFPWPQEVRPDNGLAGQRGYLVEAVERHLVETGVVDRDRLREGGLRITTTIEPDKQRALEEAVADQLLAELDPGQRGADAYARAGATSIDTATGRVVAMYGGTDYTEQFVNSATRRDYQAASTFKPFVYAAALEYEATSHQGTKIGPDTKYDGRSGREVVSQEGQPTGWSPENEGEKSFGTITVAEAMDKSVNAVFAQMGVDVGPERVKETATALGLPEDTPGLADADGSIALGTATPSTLDLAVAYATLARHGTYLPPVLVTEVRAGGEVLPLPEPEEERVLSRQAADGTTALLEGVVRDGTGTAAGTAGRPAAGKTGTAEHDRAAWFAGYTPELATVVAVFGQDPHTGAQRELYGVAGLSRVNGGGFPARIWGQYTGEALAGEPKRDFELRGVPVPDVKPEPDERPEESGEPSAPAEPGEASATPVGPSREPEPPGGYPAPAPATPPAPSPALSPAPSPAL